LPDLITTLILIDNVEEAAEYQVFFLKNCWSISRKTFIAIMRSQPNLIVTGTPGVGKTTHCEILAQNTGLKHLSINDIVKERGCHDGYDEEFKSWIVDEDKVCTLIACL
jgi:2-phosphoglycerate kinase